MLEGEKTIAARVRDALCEVFEVRASTIFSSASTRHVLNCRLLGYYVLDQHSEMSHVEIGDFFGTRDRSTVQRGIARIALDLKHKPFLQAQLDRVKLLAGICTIPCFEFALSFVGGKSVDFVFPEDRHSYDRCARPDCRLPRAEHQQPAAAAQEAA